VMHAFEVELRTLGETQVQEVPLGMKSLAKSQSVQTVSESQVRQPGI
jgi:hypothetical protein